MVFNSIIAKAVVLVFVKKAPPGTNNSTIDLMEYSLPEFSSGGKVTVGRIMKRERFANPIIL